MSVTGAFKLSSFLPVDASNFQSIPAVVIGMAETCKVVGCDVAATAACLSVVEK